MNINKIIIVPILILMSSASFCMEEPEKDETTTETSKDSPRSSSAFK